MGSAHCRAGCEFTTNCLTAGTRKAAPSPYDSSMMFFGMALMLRPKMMRKRLARRRGVDAVLRFLLRSLFADRSIESNNQATITWNGIFDAWTCFPCGELFGNCRDEFTVRNRCKKTNQLNPDCILSGTSQANARRQNTPYSRRSSVSNAIERPTQDDRSDLVRSSASMREMQGHRMLAMLWLKAPRCTKLQLRTQRPVFLDDVALEPVFDKADQAKDIHPAIAHFLQGTVNTAQHFLMLEGMHGEIDARLIGETLLGIAMDAEGCEKVVRFLERQTILFDAQVFQVRQAGKQLGMLIIDLGNIDQEFDGQEIGILSIHRRLPPQQTRYKSRKVSPFTSI
jgi:hypothetical protein